MLLNGQVGPQTNSDGANPPLRQGKTGELSVANLHGRFYEQAVRGNIYTGGISNTALVAANAIATGLTATAQPVIGLYNPSTSLVNLVILKATVVMTAIANTAVAPGGFAWVYSVGNSGVSTGSAPINTKTLTAVGSSGKFFAVSTALTGLTNNLAFLKESDIAPINAAGPGTAIHQPQGCTFEQVDGAIIVPPGGVVGIMNQVATTTVSVAVGIVWEEVAI